MLKRLSEALATQTIHAVIGGSAINNDGSSKVDIRRPALKASRRSSRSPRGLPFDPDTIVMWKPRARAGHPPIEVPRSARVRDMAGAGTRRAGWLVDKDQRGAPERQPCPGLIKAAFVAGAPGIGAQPEFHHAQPEIDFAAARSKSTELRKWESPTVHCGVRE